MNKWLPDQGNSDQATLRLFCFPYAGGSADVFREWLKALPSTIQVCPVQLPGRGSRSFEAPFTKLTLLAQVIALELLPYWNEPFALFGHSMGAIVSFELARYLRKERLGEPIQLFVSGWRSPQIPSRERPSYDLPQAEFLNKLRHLGGSPEDLLENAKFIQWRLPLLRADFEMIQTYAYSPEPRLACPITALGGLQDQVAKREDLEAWREQTTANFSVRMLPGDHFFLHKAQTLLLKVLEQELDQTMSKVSE